jgi:hypothetical protein
MPGLFGLYAAETVIRQKTRSLSLYERNKSYYLFSKVFKIYKSLIIKHKTVLTWMV